MSELRLVLQAGLAQAELARIKQRLTHPAPLMRSMSVELLSLTEAALAREGVIGGAKWPSLKPSTIKQREKIGRWPGKMLQRSVGGLASSIQPFHSDKQAGLTSSKPYAAIQQLGGKAGPGKKVTLPARGYMPMRAVGSDLELTEAGRESLLGLLGQFAGGR